MSKNEYNLFLAWDKIKWPMVTKRIRRIQRRIYKAQRQNKPKLVHALQKRLLFSIDAKLLAVHHVTTLNKGRKTPGVDKLIATTNQQKTSIAQNLHLDGKAQPIRRVWISEAPGKKEQRPLGIPTIRDRAKQELARLAIEPQWEAMFEPNSYGLRPGRGVHDAIEAIFLALHHKKPKWIFDADIRKCFNQINHDALIQKLNTFPQMEQQIRAWLKAEIMTGYAEAPKTIITSEMRSPQGGIISPLLANIALHGLEEHLKTVVENLHIKFRPSMNRGKNAKRKAMTIVRYADDFVIIHENKEVLDICIAETQNWLSKDVGLEISQEKSQTVQGPNGFLFLGHQIIQVKKQNEYKTKIVPSRESCKALLKNVRNTIANNKSASAYDLIGKLRPRIIGWANFFRYCECSQTFNKLTHLIFQMLRAWVFRRDTRNGRKAIKQKYFPCGKTYSFQGTKHEDNWILNGKKEGKDNFLPHIHWVKSKKFVKVKGNKSPYDGDAIYWLQRCKKHSPLPTRTKTLLTRQKMKCNICKKTLNPRNPRFARV